jgi:hypothetical protein
MASTPTDWEPLIHVTTPRDWQEDFSHENGNYNNDCMVCGEVFRGHKRRVVCKVCDIQYRKADNRV